MRYIIWPLIILLIVIRYFTARPVYKNGDSLRISTTILSDPIKYSTSQGVKIIGLKAYLPLFPEIFYGDKIVVEGIVNNGKLESAKLVKVLDQKTILSGLRNRIIDFYQKVLPAKEAGLIG